MKYSEFISILKKLNYSKSFYKAGNLYYHNYSYGGTFIGEKLEIMISYVIDESNRVRQQFFNEEVVRLHIKPTGTSGDWKYLPYDECINSIIDSGYGDVVYIRDFKLGKLGINE